MPVQTPNHKHKPRRVKNASAALLEWYDIHGRDLPWRYKNGDTPDPYTVWLSEIMLQQTTVTAVKPYHAKFLALWPTLKSLAGGEQDAVMNAWAGLGYYSRARNLHKCAQTIMQNHGGQFPQSLKELKSLPGIGDYTAAAIMTIVHGQPETVVDGNIERVMSRFFAIQTPLPKSKPEIKGATSQFFKKHTPRPGDLAQAMMDLGSMICTPASPKCKKCPLMDHCAAYKQGVQLKLPKKIKKKPKPKRVGAVYCVLNEKDEVLLQKRPETGLLANMIGLPTSEWLENDEGVNAPDELKHLSYHAHNSTIKHVFTHFHLTLYPKSVTVKSTEFKLPRTYHWHPIKILSAAGLPKVFSKVTQLLFET